MSLTSRADIFNAMAQGKGTVASLLCHSAGTITGGGALSGFWTVHIAFNSLGTTAPTTLVGFQLPPATSQLLSALVHWNSSNGRGTWLARIYNFGTVNLAATGDQFTADASVTFPVTRTQLGVAAQPLTLVPLCYITTATTVTAPIFTLKTAGGAAGYVNQDGSNVVGTKTMTMPAAATAAESAYICRLEQGDSGVRSISAVQVNTAGSAGAARMFGAELIACVSDNVSGVNSGVDSIFGGLRMMDLMPAAPTTGTLTSYLVLLATSNSNSGGFPNPQILAVLN